MKRFSNEVIKAPNPEKPHIIKIDGLWRVSPLPRFTGWPREMRKRWVAAYDFVNSENQPLLDKMFSKEKKND